MEISINSSFDSIEMMVFYLSLFVIVICNSRHFLNLNFFIFNLKFLHFSGFSEFIEIFNKFLQNCNVLGKEFAMAHMIKGKAQKLCTPHFCNP